jgi:hypothetical protein
MEFGGVGRGGGLRHRNAPGRYGSSTLWAKRLRNIEPGRKSLGEENTWEKGMCD